MTTLTRQRALAQRQWRTTSHYAVRVLIVLALILAALPWTFVLLRSTTSDDNTPKQPHRNTVVRTYA